MFYTTILVLLFIFKRTGNKICNILQIIWWFKHWRKEQVRDLGIMMSNTATFTLRIINIVKKARDKMGWVVSVVGSALSCRHCWNRLSLALESMDRKRYTNHGLTNNTRLTRFFNPTNKKSRDDVTASQKIAVLQCCGWLLAEMPSSRAEFDLNNRKSGVNRHLRFCQFPKNSEVCLIGCVLFIKPWHHTLHISELKYAPTHGTFPSFWKLTKPQVPIHSRFTII